MIKLPESVSFEDLLTSLREINRDSINLLTRFNENANTTSSFEANLNIRNLKSGPVTQLDLDLNTLIIEKLSKDFQKANWQFLSEESFKSKQFCETINQKWIWIIDPLDGTKDFINKTGEYAIHIALTYEKKPILGAVIIPSKKEFWLSVDKIGTWIETNNGQQKILQTKDNKDISQLTYVASKTHRSNDFNKLLNNLSPNKLIGMGSVGFKVTSILRGDADVYISYAFREKSFPKDWDFAAPEMLMRGAGGSITNIKGENITFLDNNEFEQQDIIVASRNVNHKLICERISSFIQSIN